MLLYQPQIVPLVGKREAARMSEHVGIGRAKVSPRSRCLANVVHCLPGEWLLAFGNEQPRKRIVAMREPAADDAQLVARNRLLDAETVLQTADPHPRLRRIDMLPPQTNGLADPKPVPEHHQKQEMIPNAVAALLRGRKEPVNLRLSEVVAAALVGIRGAGLFTFYILPIGHDVDPLPEPRSGSIRSASGSLYSLHYEHSVKS